MTLFGGLIPLAVAFSLGKFCFRDVPDVLALGLGAVIESLLIFCLLAAGIARPAAFIALGAIGMLPLFCLRPRVHFPMPRGLPAVIFGVFGVLYLIHALTPEIQPDGVVYHLALPSEYARLGRFPARAGFFEMLPQGMEMLFTFACAIAKPAAAKLVNFGFLLATVPLVIELGRRLRLPDRLSGAAAMFYFCAPIAAVTGTSTYNDAALVFFTLATLLALLLGGRYLVPAGLLAGFCYAIKMSGALVPLLAAAFVARALVSEGLRHVRKLLVITAAALIPIVPWLVRNAIMTGNPIAPLGNALFPTQYFHLTMERELAQTWSHYNAVSFRAAPWELAAGGALQGTFGPVFLLMPIGLLALRRSIGRWVWLAAILLAIPWFSNHGARFLMPSLPFFFLALAMSLDMLARPALWLCLALHAMTCWPSVAALYQNHDAWRLRDYPWRAALRLESEQDYLTRALPEYKLATLLHEQTRPGETTFALLGVANVYTDRPIVDWWQSALANRLLDTLRVASSYAGAPFYDLRADFPAQPLKGLRFRLKVPHPGEWDLDEIRLYSGEDRVYNSPQWLLDAWPNPWEAPLAFDDNFASRWRTWQSMRPGMFFEVRFEHPQRLTSAVLASHSPVYDVPVEFYGLNPDGAWTLLSNHPSRLLRKKQDLRRPALHYLKRSGIDYILAPTESAGVSQLGKILVEQHDDWGLEDAGQMGPVHLLRIPQ